MKNEDVAAAVARLGERALESVDISELINQACAAATELLDVCQRTTEELSAVLASPGQRVGAGLPA